MGLCIMCSDELTIDSWPSWVSNLWTWDLHIRTLPTRPLANWSVWFQRSHTKCLFVLWNILRDQSGTITKMFVYEYTSPWFEVISSFTDIYITLLETTWPVFVKLCYVITSSTFLTYIVSSTKWSIYVWEHIIVTHKFKVLLTILTIWNC